MSVTAARQLVEGLCRGHVPLLVLHDVVYDERGHFIEPHGKRTIGLGTLNVRDYLSRA